jgi:hypothetical protein
MTEVKSKCPNFHEYLIGGTTHSTWLIPVFLLDKPGVLKTKLRWYFLEFKRKESKKIQKLLSGLASAATHA